MIERNDNLEITEPNGVVNEFGSIEIEQKFQVLESHNSEFLDSVIGILLDTNNFIKVKNLEKFGWVFHFDYYACFDNEKVRQAFHTIHHESTPKFWIRKKVPAVPAEQKDSLAPLIRSEDVEMVDCPYNDEYIAPVVANVRETLGKDIFLLGRLTRQKNYTFIENIHTQRIYNISVDSCQFMGRQMSQVEIEYKWRRNGAMDNFGDLGHVSNEIESINKGLAASPIGKLIEKTSLTKFDWMVNIWKENQEL